MPETASRWVPFTAEQIAHLPEEGGIFEIATLVRNVVFIGRAEGNVRRAATQMLDIPGRLPQLAGGLYLRFLPAAQEVEALTARLREFEQSHHGELPSANRLPVRPVTVARSQQQAA